MGIVNLVHNAGAKEDFYPIDYRIYAPDQDGKTKNDHFAEMVVNAVFVRNIQAKRILSSWTQIVDWNRTVPVPQRTFTMQSHCWLPSCLAFTESQSTSSWKKALQNQKWFV
jgi:hypothetical protein